MIDETVDYGSKLKFFLQEATGSHGGIANRHKIIFMKFPVLNRLKSYLKWPKHSRYSHASCAWGFTVSC